LSMKHETAEWVAKAEADLATARREVAVDESPNYDAVCFHSQQCAEKYLKAILVEHAAKVSRIHDLEILVNEVTVHSPGIHAVLKFARILSAMAVEVRYPGMGGPENIPGYRMRLLIDCGMKVAFRGHLPILEA
jgi:HEPN domain-containing protein